MELVGDEGMGACCGWVGVGVAVGEGHLQKNVDVDMICVLQLFVRSWRSPSILAHN